MVETERIPQAPPIIAALSESAERPLWSVMIPVYNCLRFLAETLESVLAQAPGPEQMQIAVVDDCSTDGDVGALVESLGKNRVEYIRQPQNVGSLRNFETCLNRAKGRWIHLLHGDDQVMPGFYAEIENLLTRHPEAGAAFTGTIHIKENDEELWVDGALMPQPGIMKSILFDLALGQKIHPPSIVVKRSVYEQLGGFFAVTYGEDWEMWTRIAARFPIAYSPVCLARYRYLNDASISSQSLRSGQNVRDIIKVINIIQHYLPAGERKVLKNLARQNYAFYCAGLAHELYKKNPDAALVQAKGALSLSNKLPTLRFFWGFYKQYFIDHGGFKKLLKAQ